MKKEVKSKDITERVKTFEDACRELGDGHPFVLAYQNLNLCNPEIAESNRDILAYVKLRVICSALNEGWTPRFTEDEVRWRPWFMQWSGYELSEKSDEWKAERHLLLIDNYLGDFAGFAYECSSNTPLYSSSRFGFCLCFKSEALATYCGKQFIELWADFNLIRKQRLGKGTER